MNLANKLIMVAGGIALAFGVDAHSLIVEDIATGKAVCPNVQLEGKDITLYETIMKC